MLTALAVGVSSPAARSARYPSISVCSRRTSSSMSNFAASRVSGSSFQTFRALPSMVCCGSSRIRSIRVQRTSHSWALDRRMPSFVVGGSSGVRETSDATRSAPSRS